MSSIDRQRIAAMQVLKRLGYRFDGTAWIGEPRSDGLTVAADRIHALLMDRAETLAGGAEGSPQEDELAAIAGALDAYEAERWPGGRVSGGKG